MHEPARTTRFPRLASQGVLPGSDARAPGDAPQGSPPAVGFTRPPAPSSVRVLGEPAQVRLDASDPRWVLAVRVAAALDGGTSLTPDARDALARDARVMGLGPFDAARIVALVEGAVLMGLPPLGPGVAADLAQIDPPEQSRSSLSHTFLVLAVAGAVLAVCWVALGVL